MKKILIVAFILVSKISYGQIIDIPDANFKNALISENCIDTDNNGIGDLDADLNNDGNIDLGEASKIEYLILRFKKIKNIEGINNFINLITLNVSYNDIETIVIKDLKKITKLECHINKLTNLKLYNLPNLTKINCYENKINLLDLFSLPELSVLNCFNNNLANLDLLKFTKLKELNCNQNQLSSLDLSNLSQMINLNCKDNPIVYLFIKIGKKDNQYLIVYGDQSISFICADENNVQMVKQLFPNAEVNTYCNFSPGGKFYSILGKSKFDGDNKGCNSNGINVPNLKYIITNGTISGSLVANASGIYSIDVQEGSHSIFPYIENPQFFDITPASITVTFPSTSDTIIQDFCITPKQAHRQVDITILPLSPPARPGFQTQYKVVITNKGNQTESGTLNFRYNDALLDYIKTDVNPTTQSDGLVAWKFKDIFPFETRTYTVTLKVNKPTDTPAVNAGDVLQLTASILDNIFILKNTVVGSFDPNDKTCLEGDKITPDMVGKYVHYLIRFENTGTYAAENVVVKDIIDEAIFDVASLQITDASHRAYARINKNIVEFIFESIQLPFDDANNDGFIAFKIKMKPTLKLGDELKNKANIYFDYNFPIVTNVAKSVIANIVSTGNVDINDDITIYPNPAGDYINIGSKEDIIKIEIYDLAGRILQSTGVVNNQVDVKTLGTGTYLVKIYAKDWMSVKKMEKV